MINGKNIGKIFDSKECENKEIYVRMNNNPKNIYMKPKERMFHYPQVINNYDVNVKVNIKKLNDNNFNIENMNISELLGNKFGYNNHRNKNTLNVPKEFFSKTDNNIKYLEPLINNQIIKKEGLYNNMIADLKNEFKEIKKKHEMNKENKEKNNKNIRNFLFHENNININKDSSNNILNKNTWNNKSVNNSYKKKKNIHIIREEINNDLIKEKKISSNHKEYNDIQNNNYEMVNKNRTQNNFYKMTNDYINALNEKTKIEEQIKKEEILVNNKKNLKNAIIYFNNKKSKNSQMNSLNITNDFINNNNDNSFIKLNKGKEDLDLTLKNNKEIKKQNTLIKMTKNNNIMKNYISHPNNQKASINKCNSYISKKHNSLFNNTQKFNKNDFDSDNDIDNINKHYIKISQNVNSKVKVRNKQKNLLYLDNRINKIKNKMIINDYNNIINHTEIKHNIQIEKIISFCFINKINKGNKIDDLNLNITGKIIKIQNNIILELKQKQFLLKNELIKKYKEINNFKNICLKLMWFIKDNFIKIKNNKKLQMIQNQIIKENSILRKLFINKQINCNSINHNKDVKNIGDLEDKKFFVNTLNKLNDKINSENSKGHGRMNTFENNNNENRRNISIERFNDIYQKNKANLVRKNISSINEANFKYINFKEKKNKYIGDNSEIIYTKLGKKIKYLVKDKNNLSLTFENFNNKQNV